MLKNYQIISKIKLNKNDKLIVNANIKTIEMVIDYRIKLEIFESDENYKYFK